jgi:3-hydroxybutyryl-CoA dehydratase
MTLYLDDFTTGQVFTSVGRTMTEADIMAFAGVSGDFNQLHINEQWVTANTPFTGRIAHGLLVLAISSGLATPGMEDVETIAYLEASRKFVGPTYPGDTIHTVTTVLDTRPSRSRPGMGVLTTSVEVVNQHGEVVQTGTDAVMITTRPQDA